MAINYHMKTQYGFYEEEINKAVEWLFNTRDEAEGGWAWVQFIRPNEQNTAEVISVLADHPEWFEEDPERADKILESIRIWLLDTSHAKISIDFCWVLIALQKVRDCAVLAERIGKDEINRAAEYCLDWLCCHINSGEKGDGWGDNDAEISSTIRTALALIGLNRELRYLEQHRNTDEESVKKYDRYLAVAEKATRWLLSIQHMDGGWGNLEEKRLNREYEATHCFSYADLKYQCDSNASSTGYAMLALASSVKGKYAAELKRGSHFLHTSQLENGCWEIFTEIGIRDNVRFTFRHFSTAWAIQAMITGKTADYTDECVIRAFNYLTSLQDDNYGGWKSSPDADNYTWATCNALSTIKLLQKELSEVQAKQFMNIVCEWWALKRKDANYSFTVGRTSFAFNGPTGALFCITFSIMVSALLFVMYATFSPLLAGSGDFVQKFVYSVLTVAAAVILGLPWIVFVKNRFHKDLNGWIESIGWVYGIITGFVLVLYQFIL